MVAPKMEDDVVAGSADAEDAGGAPKIEPDGEAAAAVVVAPNTDDEVVEVAVDVPKIEPVVADEEEGVPKMDPELAVVVLLAADAKIDD